MNGISKLSVLVLSWNGLKHLKTCLPAMLDQRDPGIPWELLVLDNGSKDGTADWVGRNYPSIRLVRSKHNLGFAKGNNFLAQHATGDGLVFLNNDTRPDTDWLAGLARGLREAPADVACVSGLTLNWDGDRLDFARGVMTFDGHAFQQDFGKPMSQVTLPAAASEIFFAGGANMAIRRTDFEAVGGFDEDYFAYFEDVDLGWRLWSSGRRVLFQPEAVVHHRSQATSDKLGAYNRGFLFERNAFVTAYKNYDQPLWPHIMPAVMLTLMSRTQTLALQNNPLATQLALDPYSGLTANTEILNTHYFGRHDAITRQETSRDEVQPEKGWRYRFRDALFRTLTRIFPDRPLPILLKDRRTISQMRALHYLLNHLDPLSHKRRRVQALRQRSDREIFARFPPVLVAVYPGDEALFKSPAFTTWLPGDLPLIRTSLSEILHFDENP